MGKLLLMILLFTFFKSQELNKLFPFVENVRLHFYSYNSSAMNNYTYKGTALSKDFYSLLNINVLNEADEYFAIFKFNYSKDLEGYVLRTPSQYQSSNIELYLLDKISKTVITHISVADGFGDGSWFFNRDGWLLDLNNDGQLDLLSIQKDWEEDDDEKATETTEIKVYLFINNNFVKTDMEIPNLERYKIKNWIG